jgi:peptidoglycan/LPS O-acetylase OafA/YrhL
MLVSQILQKEKNNLALIRILLASLVIIGHTIAINGQGGFFVDPIRWFVSYTYCGAWAVKVFFFISGMLVTYSLLQKGNLNYFVVSRVFRILPALLFVLLITVFLIGPLLTTVSLKEYFSSKTTYSYLFYNLVFETRYFLPGVFENNSYKSIINGSLWSLRYEMGAYIFLLGGFLFVRKHPSRKLVMNIVFVFFIIEPFLPARIVTGWLGPNPEINLLAAAFSFGGLFAVNAERFKLDVFSVIGSLLLFFTFRHSQFAEIILVYVSCIVLLYLSAHPLLLSLKIKMDISYGIYLWGFVLQQVVLHYLGHVQPYLHCFIVLLAVCLLSVITHILVEKPAIDYGKKVYQFCQKKSARFFKSNKP